MLKKILAKVIKNIYRVSQKKYLEKMYCMWLLEHTLYQTHISASFFKTTDLADCMVIAEKIVIKVKENITMLDMLAFNILFLFLCL